MSLEGVRKEHCCFDSAAGGLLIGAITSASPAAGSETGQTKSRTAPCEGANSKGCASQVKGLSRPASWVKNTRATPCKQQRSAALAWSWDEPVPTGLSCCLVEQLLGHANIALAGRNAYAEFWWTRSSWVATRSTTAVVPTLVSTGSGMRCQR